MNNPIDVISAAEIAAARNGRTWPMLAVKQALSQLPLEQAFAQYAGALGCAGSTRLVQKAVDSMRGFAERNAAVFVEIEPGGGEFSNEPSRVIGESDHRVLHHRKRSLYVTALRGASTRGRSQLIELDNRVLVDFEDQEYMQIDDQLELDSAVFRSRGSTAWVLEESARETVRIEQCFSLLGPNSFAFGHWIAEYLPRLWIALESGLLPQVPVLIDQGMSRQHRQSLESLLPSGMPIIEIKPLQLVAVDLMWCAPSFYYAPIYPRFNERFRYDLVAAPPDRSRQIFSGMLDRLMPMAGASGEGSKIYLARKPASHRKLVNREVIEQIAERHGFRRVYLEDLDFIEQLRLVRQAQWLVGPEGSAFFLGFLARQGTRACVLNHPHTAYLTTVTALLEAAEVDCTVLTGPFRRIEPDGYVHFSDYEIDPEVFDRFLLEWSAA